MHFTHLIPILLSLPGVLATTHSQSKDNVNANAFLEDPDFMSDIVERAFAATMKHNIGEKQVALQNCQAAHPDNEGICSGEYLKTGGYRMEARAELERGLDKLEQRRKQDKVADHWDGIIKQVLDSFEEDFDGIEGAEQVLPFLDSSESDSDSDNDNDNESEIDSMAQRGAASLTETMQARRITKRDNVSALVDLCIDRCIEGKKQQCGGIHGYLPGWCKDGNIERDCERDCKPKDMA